MKPETYDQPPAMIDCPECQARIPNDGNCWYCENNPTYTDQPITLDADLTFLDSGKRNGRTEFRARLVRAGRITTASGQPGRIMIPPEAIQNAVDRGLFEGLAVFADHPGWFDSPSVKALIGMTHNAEFNGLTESADATIRFYTNKDEPDSRLANVIAQTLATIMQDKEEGLPPPNIGVSIVFWPTWRNKSETEPQFPLILDQFKKIDSADIVFGPAADGRILEALSIYGHESKGERNMTEPRPTYETAVNQPTPIVEERETAGPNVLNEQAPAPAVDALAAWKDAAGQEAARSIIFHSQLPDISKERLAAQIWNEPNQLYAAIDQEREYLAKLTQQNVVQLYGGPPRGSGITQMKTGLDAMENAIDWLFGVDEAKTPEPQMRRFDQVYMMLTGDYDFHGVYHPERVFLAAADTGTLANMAANAMNKVVISQLALLTHYRWYEMIVKPTPNDGSLQNMQWTSFGGVGTLPVVSEGGAYDELTVDDVKEADSFYKYGGYVGITREMIKNSDIQRIQAVPRALAAASVKTRSAKIASIFSQASGLGPTLDQDSTALFDAGHGNYATTALGTDNTAWKAAATECFKQTEVSSGDRIGVFPKFCLVPPDLYHTALAIFGYGEGMPTSYAPFSEDRGIGDPRPRPIAVPHFTDTNNWYYLADPMVWPVVHMSFSADPSGRGFPAPELWAAASPTGGLLFAADVLPIKIRDEFAYGVNGYKGIGGRVVA